MSKFEWSLVTPNNPQDNLIKPQGPTIDGVPIDLDKIYGTPNEQVNAPENEEFMNDAVRVWDEEE